MNLTFPIKRIGPQRYRVQMDDFWETAYAHLKAAGFPKDPVTNGYMGAPPI